MTRDCQQVKRHHILTWREHGVGEGTKKNMDRKRDTRSRRKGHEYENDHGYYMRQKDRKPFSKILIVNTHLMEETDRQR